MKRLFLFIKRMENEEVGATMRKVQLVKRFHGKILIFLDIIREKMNLLQNFLLAEESILTAKFFIVLSTIEINLK